jgi:hypothetical protein
MKKILLTFGFCIGVFVGNDQAFGMDAAEAFKSGTNAVFAYYRVDGTPLTTDDKEVIWSIERTFKFPMSATPANRAYVLPFLTRLCTEERNMIQELLGDKYGIVSIPNSMYQLFVVNEFLEYEEAHTVFEARFDQRSGKTINEEVSCASNKRALIFSGSGSEGCLDYLDASPVQERFWNVNELALRFVRNIKEDLASLRVDDLKAAGRELIEDLCEKFTEGRIGCDKFCDFFGCREGLNFPSAFLKSAERPIIARWSEYARSKILQCVDADTDTMVDPAFAGVHSVYRGEALARSYLNADIGKVAFSFSDGLFGGSIFDCKDGMAMGFALNIGRLVRVDLDKLSVITGTCPMFLPLALSLGSTYGKGEYFHPRIKMLRGFVLDGKMAGAWNHNDRAEHALDFVEDSDAFRSQLRDPVITEWEPFAG